MMEQYSSSNIPCLRSYLSAMNMFNRYRNSKFAKIFTEKQEKDMQDRPKAAKNILLEQIEEVMEEYDRPNTQLFLSAFAAGMEIGFSVLLMGVIYELFHDTTSESSLHMMIALAYPIGFLFVVIGRSVLFTEHTTLAILPVLSNRASLGDLLKHWAVIYSANLLGGYVFAFGLVLLCGRMDIISDSSFYHLAEKMIKYDSLTILLSGLFAGWLMGLVSWLITASQETISRMLIVIIVTSVIGLAGLHHSIVGSIEIICGYLVSPDVTLADYGRVQLFTTLGNILGGMIFVGVLKFSHVNITD